jgi:CheY-like chemotaxis protein
VADSLTGIRIVIAEDHDDTRDFMEQALRHLGGTVASVATAREALDVVAAADILVTDLSLPDEDGVWLLEQVNQLPRSIPVIAVSGFADVDVPRFLRAAFAWKLVKPVDPWQLADVILEVVRGIT